MNIVTSAAECRAQAGAGVLRCAGGSSRGGRVGGLRRRGGLRSRSAARFAACAALVVAASAPARADDDPAARATVEFLVPRDDVYTGEVVTVRMRVSYDAEWFRQHVIPTFRRAMDVPVRVEAPWFDALPGARRVADSSAGAVTATFVMNDAVVAGTRSAADERGRVVLEVARRFVPEVAAEIVLDAPALKFAWSQEFEDDLVQGRVPSQRREARIAGAARTLRVLALPEAGRPPDFAGAVGAFTMTASAEPVTLDAGGTLRLKLVLDGEGNASGFPAPRLDALDGFHVLGTLDDRGAPRRAVVCEMSPLGSDVREIPAIGLPVFDPGPPAAYRVVRTAPIPLTVRGAPRASVAPGAPSAPLAPGVPAPGSPASGADGASQSEIRIPPLVWAVVIALGTACGVVVARMMRRRRRAAAETPARPDPAAAFREEVARRDGDVGAALTVFLASQLGCPEASVVSPDLAARLVASGVRCDLAERAADAVERSVAARYGSGSPLSAEVAAGLVEEFARDAASRAVR